MSEEILVVENLSKTIKRKEIVKELSFSLRAGEVFGFLGPNGAGKTTTIRMLVGLIKPTSGSIKICGYNLATHFKEALNCLGCIVENPELYPYLSGMENLQHFARMLDHVTKERILEVVEMVGLENRVHDLVKTYSLGMRQRLGIAQALLGNPKLLILDEPTNGLDPAGIREMREFIRQLAKTNGLSVLVSSHLLSEVQLLCDRVGIISKGELLHVASVEQLLSEQERLIWRVRPAHLALQILQGYTEIKGESSDGLIITPYEEEKVSLWNRVLIEGGVEILEMHRRLPTLEDMFMEWTGGQSID
ncbi:ABC transporter ATP-binding protein [Ammoniphilus resinae]|uniref:ABC-2 type transport system ATP-binding protein n=1 Tax=Ammoniphilus resinae TaxID=861532 RepID=A0ABS4GKC6_9BACL|nr:ABC transporter ATP-binding protein [Ammoniphilus resinae]MBP1930708.1 ABC-2 type transport system ATP-binding protein [Ammoniphilus resinae]